MECKITGTVKDLWKCVQEKHDISSYSFQHAFTMVSSADGAHARRNAVIAPLNIPVSTRRRSNVIWSLPKINVETTSLFFTVAKTTKNQRRSDVALLTVALTTKNQRRSDVDFLTVALSIKINVEATLLF